MGDAARRPRRWLWGAAIVVGLLASLFAIAWWRSDPVTLLDAEIARLRAEGYATTPAEWNPNPIPDEQNGAAAIDAADRWLLDAVGPADRWTAPGRWRSDHPERWWQSLDAAQTRELDQFLARVRPYFDQVDAALDLPRMRWRPVVDPSGMLGTDEVVRLQRLAMLHEACARRPSDVADRLHSIGARLRIAARVEEPSLLTGMVLTASVTSAARDVLDLLAEGTLPAEATRVALDDLLRPSRSDALPGLVRAEIVEYSVTLRSAYAGRLVGPGGPIVPRLGNPAFRVAWWLYLGGPDDLLRALHQASNVCERRYADRRRRYVEIDRDAPRIAHTATLVLPIAARKAAQTDAHLRLARLALAATERRETTGAWPASLDDLRDAFADGGVPTDPFTDAPFSYEVRGRTLRIASAGRCDDEPAVSEEQLAEDGLVWTIER